MVFIVVGIIVLLQPPHKGNSIAVMPFVNVGADPDVEYLSDGITESIINSLSQLPNLRVMARSSVFHYKGQEVDPQKVGEDLGVEVVLTGRLMQRGDTLIVRSELVDVQVGSQLWGAQYAQKFSSVLLIQEEIAKEISTTLRPRLTSEEKKTVTKRYTEKPDAYRSYLKGRFYWNKRTRQGFSRAIEHFKEAIEIDPAYALAYAGIADCYVLMGNYAFLPPKEAHVLGKSAATKALEIDERLAEAHVSLGAIYEYEWRWNDAEKEYRRAIELNPNYATGHQWYGEFSASTGKLEKAVQELMHAQTIDPLSLIINTSLAYSMYLSGMYDRSIEQFQKAIELDPDFVPAVAWSAFPHIQQQSFDRAIELTQKAITLTNGQAQYKLQLGYIYTLVGKKDDARKILDEMSELSERTYVPPASMALLYEGLGEKDKAFEILHEAVERHSIGFFLPQIRYDPIFEDIRSDERFSELMKKMGFEK